jgi:hypothetical protein
LSRYADPVSSLSETVRIKVLYGVACALAYMHQMELLHLTVCLRTVYLDDDFNPILTNYVFSKTAYRAMAQGPFVQEVTFVGPELLKAGPRSPPNDVYAFGMLTYGLNSDDDRVTRQAMPQTWLRGGRVKLPRQFLPFMKALIFRCIAHNLAQRPDMVAICSKIHDMPEFLLPGIDEAEFVAYRDSIDPSPFEDLRGCPGVPPQAKQVFSIPQLSQRGSSFAGWLVGLQVMLSDLRPSWIPDAIEFVQGWLQMPRPEAPGIIVRNVLAMVRARFLDISLFAELIAGIDCFSVIRSEVFSQIFDPLTNESVFPDKVPSLWFLWWLLQRRAVSAAEIVEKIAELHRDRPTYRRVLCLLFCFFAPEIEETMPDLAAYIVEAFRAQMEDLSFPQALKDFFSELPGFRADGWARLRQTLSEQRSVQPVKECIRAHDLPRLKQLVREGADLNERLVSEVFEPCILAHDGPSLIAYTALCGASLCFQYGKMRGLDVNVRDGKYYTLSHFAAIGRSADIVRYVYHRKKYSDGFMQIATRFFLFGHYLCFNPKISYNKPDKFGQVMVHVAAASNNVAVMLQCLQYDPEQANFRESFGWTPLHSAAKKGSADVMKVLIEMANIEVNARDSWGQTPLHVACQGVSPDCVVILLKADGVNVNARDPHGHTPLHLAVEGGNTKNVKLLLADQRVVLTGKDKVCFLCTKFRFDFRRSFLMKRTPYDCARKHGFVAICRLFEDYHAKADRRCAVA